MLLKVFDIQKETKFFPSLVHASSFLSFPNPNSRIFSWKLRYSGRRSPLFASSMRISRAHLSRLQTCYLRLSPLLFHILLYSPSHNRRGPMLESLGHNPCRSPFRGQLYNQLHSRQSYLSHKLKRNGRKKKLSRTIKTVTQLPYPSRMPFFGKVKTHDAWKITLEMNPS